MARLDRQWGTIPPSPKSRGWKLPRAIVNRFIHCLARYLPMSPSMRVWLHRRRGVHVGQRVFMGTEVFIDDAEPDLVVIEDEVTIIARCCILAHAYYPRHLAKYFPKAAERRGVTIRKGAYLGLGVVVLPGVTIGAEAVVGAGAVVTKDVPAGSLALGVPARVVKQLKSDPVTAEGANECESAF